VSAEAPSAGQADATIRSRRYAVLLIVVALSGVVVSLATWCFLEGIYQIPAGALRASPPCRRLPWAAEVVAAPGSRPRARCLPGGHHAAARQPVARALRAPTAYARSSEFRTSLARSRLYVNFNDGREDAHLAAGKIALAYTPAHAGVPAEPAPATLDARSPEPGTPADRKQPAGIDAACLDEHGYTVRGSF